MFVKVQIFECISSFSVLIFTLRDYNAQDLFFVTIATTFIRHEKLMQRVSLW